MTSGRIMYALHMVYYVRTLGSATSASEQCFTLQ